MSERLELDSKVAVVTGGTRGIGRAVAEALGGAGATVIVTGRSADRARAAAAEMSAQSANPIEGIEMDVSNQDAVEQAMKSILKEHARVDILVNNAGITRDNLLMRMKVDDWNAVMATNLNGLYYCSHAVLRPMIRQRSGRIINMSSVVGLMGNAGQTNYAASKAAILGFTKALAREVASRNITVNAVAPGYVETDMTSELPADTKQLLETAIPMQRIGTPADIAHAVLFLASESAGYITGQVIQVNGGLYM